MFPPRRPIAVTRRALAEFVGPVPARNSATLFCPSASGSQVAQETLFVVVPSPPKYCARHEAGMLSSIKPGMLTVTGTLAPTPLLETITEPDPLRSGVTTPSTSTLTMGLLPPLGR